MTLTQRSLAPAVAFSPEDNPDWDHARNKRLALRVPEAEWCHSSLTELGPDGFYMPTSDFSYEGWLCLLYQENWKILDRLGFQVLDGEEAQTWEGSKVEASPEKVVYHYTGPAGELAVTYALLETGVEAVRTLTVSFKLKPAGKQPLKQPLKLLVKPIVDMRHMYFTSDPGRHRIKRVEDKYVTVVNSQRWLGLGADTAFEFSARREEIDLEYKLGRGERHGVDGKVVFKRENYRGYVPGVMEFAIEDGVRLFFVVGESEAVVVKGIAEAETAGGDRLAAQEQRLDDYFKRFPKLEAAAVYRTYVMAEKFGMPVGGVRVPESGGWWFRTPWFRNVFEGYLHNYKTLVKLGKSSMINDSIRLALKYQEPGSGRLPNRIPELAADQERWAKTGSLPADYYVAPDSITMLFTFLDAYVPHIEDERLLEDIAQGFKLAFTAFKSSRLNQRQGNPVLLENGLLLTVPSHSWMNGKRVVWAEGITVTDLPIRCPLNWQIQDILHFRDSHYTWDQYQYPTYYLPEINAQWLCMLRVGQALAHRLEDTRLEEELRTIYQLAKSSYKSIFWNPHANNLYNVITLERRFDGTPSAPAIEAAALLGEEVFTRQELEYIWLAARNRLLVKRNQGGEMLPFGLITKDSPERIFYDNQQYHEAVVWPRETPYLVRLLRTLGQDATVKELLTTNLAHQMEEGAVFYNSEMLSLAEGVNPAPHADTQANPVPVKNPMQWWSQWCDAYVGDA